MEQRKSLLDLAVQRDVQISVDRELEKWPKIRVNKNLFSQAILNLLDNAVKYSRDGMEVRVDGKRVPGDVVGEEHTPGGVVLSFVNGGIPVREEEKDRIFERYYRTSEAKMLVPTGTGIGLAIVKAFVDHCGGSVEVNSVAIQATRDYVTEFRVFIPQGGAYHA
jgi:two-component system phosphate regulon sensor histidine kinase PhoR